jgi:hypothetical protein
MTKLLPDAFKEYFEITQKIKELEARRKEVAREMFDTFDDQNTKFVNTPLGGFAVRERTTYLYSDAIKEMEYGVKIAKKTEEASGTARIKSAIRYVTFIGKRGGKTWE